MSVPAGHFLCPFYRQTVCVWHISIFFLFLFFFIFFYCCQLACELIVNWLLCGLLTVFTWQAVSPYFSRVLACHLLVKWLVKIFDFLKISLILACQLIVIWVSFGLRPVTVLPLYLENSLSKFEILEYMILLQVNKDSFWAACKRYDRKYIQ